MKLRLSSKKRMNPMWTLSRAMPKGESRPGFLLVRLCMLMEVMLHAFNFHGGFECIDLFAGKCAISKAYVAKGLRACALDILLDARDDAWLYLKRKQQNPWLNHLNMHMHVIDQYSLIPSNIVQNPRKY